MFRLVTLLLGPIFAKELVEIARRRRQYVNRVLYSLALLVAVLLVAEEYRQQVRVEGRYTIRIMAATGENLFRTVSTVQYAAVFVLVPIFVCGVIAGERQERTLDILFTTRLSDGAIVLGKLGSRVLTFVLLILGAAPVLGFLPLFGGVDPGAFGRVTAATLLAVLYTGAHAIYFSATTDSPLGALVRTYWWLALWLLAVPAAVLIPVNALGLPPTDSVWLGLQGAGLLVNPLGPFLVARDGFAYQSLVRHAGVGFFPLGFAVPAAWSWFLIWRAIKRLRQQPVSLGFRLGRLPLVRVFRDRLQKDIESLLEPTHGRPGFLRFRMQNPLWWRARRARVYDRAGYVGLIQWAGWGIVFLFIGLLMAYNRRAYLDEQSAQLFLVPLWVGVTVLTAVLAATSLVGDRRRGFLDLVLLTPLRPRAVIDGTLFALWEHLRRSFGLVWLIAFYFCLADLPGPVASLCSALTGTLFCALLLLYGVLFSLMARTTSRALLATVLLPVLANLGLVVVLPAATGLAGPVLWGLSGLALLAGLCAVRRRPTLATVTAYLLALHLVLIEAAMVCGRLGFFLAGSDYPFLTPVPAHLVLAPLRGPEWRTHADSAEWLWLYVCYWSALVVNFLLVRRWAAEHFDRLTGRTMGHATPASAPGPRSASGRNRRPFLIPGRF